MKLYSQDLVKIRLEKGVVSFFNELDTRQGTMLITTLYNLPNKNFTLKTLIHFLTSLTQDKELCSKILDSFFNELDTRQGTMLMTTFYNLPT